MTQRPVVTVVRLIVLAVMGGVGFGMGCEPLASDEPGYSDSEDIGSAEQALDGCGANRKKAAVSQKCTYKGKSYTLAALIVEGTCDGDSKVVCSYDLRDTDGSAYCKWVDDKKVANACVSQEPACPEPAVLPDVPPRKLTVNLPDGNTLCDQTPAATAAQLAAFCEPKVTGQGFGQEMYDQCRSLRTTQTQDVQCCVPNPPPATTSAGVGGSGAGAGVSSGSDSSASGGGFGGGSTSSSGSSGGYSSGSGGGFGGGSTSSSGSSTSTGAVLILVP
jgi:hypothetical protein